MYSVFVCSSSSPGAGVAYYIKQNFMEENLQEKGFTNITKMVFAFRGKEVKMQVV